MEISVYKQWIANGSDYSTGIALYEAHGKSAALKKVFALGESFYTKKRLDEELNSITINSSPIVTQVNTGFKSHQTPKKKIIVEALPENLKQEYMELGPIIREISFLNSRLDTIATDEERCGLALRIVELSHKRRGIYTRLDYFQANGKQLNDLTNIIRTETVQSNELQRLRLQNERKLLASKRSKAKGKENKQAKFNDLSERISLIDQQIKALA